MRRLRPPLAPTHVRGACAPKGPCHWLSRSGRCAVAGCLEAPFPNGRWAESFADDLNTRRGIVSGRVALLPRSTEIQPHVAPIRPSPNKGMKTRRFEPIWLKLDSFRNTSGNA